jgi:predicted GTPase
MTPTPDTDSPGHPTAPPTEVVISLISHTNVGKTTLARTLLGRDVGEVRDAAHVTEFVEEHLLLQGSGGQRLVLCDTPGFGDSARLAQRMRQAHRPLGWLLTQVWDRWRDRPFWGTQQALRHVRERSDVVLYLVNAAESPEAMPHLAAELEILGWLERPVIVLLNQLGAPQPADQEEAEVQRWARHLQAQAVPGLRLHEVLPLDAFARCWVQEAVLMQTLVAAVPADRRPAMAALAQTAAAQGQATFAASMAVLAEGLVAMAGVRVALDEAGGEGWRQRLAAVLPRPGEASSAAAAPADPRARAEAALREQTEALARSGTDRLLALHGLAGDARAEILARVAQQIELHQPVSEGRAALWGGVVSGALAGLKADLATGGLTMGGGLLAGSLLGALGAAGLTRGLNVLRGTESTWAVWPDEAWAPLGQAALLRYLAVAHFGRGRGAWTAGEAPPHWAARVAQALEAERPALQTAWRQAREHREETDAAQRDLATALQRCATAVLQDLYPQAEAAWREGARLSSAL